MTEIEAFLASQKRFRCELLHADLTEEQCKQNKKLGNILSCDGCSGLNKEAGMAKPVTRVCLEPGCEKWRVIGDYCTKHARLHGVTPAPPAADDDTVRQMRIDRAAKMRAAKANKQKPAPTLPTCASVAASIMPDAPAQQPVKEPVAKEAIKPETPPWRFCTVPGCNKRKRVGSLCQHHAAEKAAGRSIIPQQSGDLVSQAICELVASKLESLTSTQRIMAAARMIEAIEVVAIC